MFYRNRKMTLAMGRQWKALLVGHRHRHRHRRTILSMAILMVESLFLECGWKTTEKIVRCGFGMSAEC